MRAIGPYQMPWITEGERSVFFVCRLFRVRAMTPCVLDKPVESRAAAWRDKQRQGASDIPGGVSDRGRVGRAATGTLRERRCPHRPPGRRPLLGEPRRDG